MNRAANINIVESLLRTVDKISEKQKHEKDEKNALSVIRKIKG